MFKKDMEDRRLYFSLIPIVGGVALASFTEVNFNLIGFACALIASVVHGKWSNESVFSQKALTTLYTAKLLGKSMDAIHLLFYMAPLSVGTLLPVAASTEALHVLYYLRENTFAVIFALVFSGVIALSLSKLCTSFSLLTCRCFDLFAHRQHFSTHIYRDW